MDDLTSRVAAVGRASTERHAIWDWVSGRRHALRRKEIADTEGTFSEGYAAALDDVEMMLIARDQRA